MVGSDNVPPYSLNNTYYQAPGFPNSGQNGFQLSVINDYPLKNETIKEFETGLELKFLRDRLSLDVTYYDKVSSNLLSPYTPLAPSTGFEAGSLNSGSMRDRGVEIVLDGDIIKKRQIQLECRDKLRKKR